MTAPFRSLARLLTLAGALAAPICAKASPERAGPSRAVVFDIEFLDMSKEGEAGPRADETARLALVSEELRRLLAQSQQLAIAPTAPQSATIAKAAPLFKCNGCEEEIAKALDADYSVSGFVQKTSNLILHFNIAIRDVRTDRIVRVGQADIRGNTDESWLRGVRYIVKNRLLAEPIPPP